MPVLSPVWLPPSGFIQNIPGPINLHINTLDGSYNQPLSLPYGSTIQPNYPYQTSFTANASGILNDIYLAHVANTQALQSTVLNVSLSTTSDSGLPLMAEVITVSPGVPGASSMGGYLLKFETPFTMNAGSVYIMTLALAAGDQVLDVCGPLGFNLQTSTELIVQSVTGPDQCLIQSGAPYVVTISPQQNGLMESITLSQLVDQTPAPGPQTLVLTIGPTGDSRDRGKCHSHCRPGPRTERAWSRIFDDSRSPRDRRKR